jgi:hypothetical protein
VKANSFGIRAFGCNIAVVADSEEVLATLQRYVLPSLPGIDPELPAKEIVVRVFRNEEGFQLECDGTAGSARDVRALVVETVRLLDEAVVKHLTNLTAVHAGVVELGGRALLLPGETKAGKSALVAELLRRGAVYFSDEYALIDTHGQAHPYPRPLLLRNAGPEQIPSLPEEWNASVGRAPVPVGWILALQYDPASSWHVTAVPQSEALLILLRNTPHALIESPRIVAALQRVCARAACYAGSRGGVADAVENILRLVEA